MEPDSIIIDELYVERGWPNRLHSANTKNDLRSDSLCDLLCESGLDDNVMGLLGYVRILREVI